MKGQLASFKNMGPRIFNVLIAVFIFMSPDFGYYPFFVLIKRIWSVFVLEFERQHERMNYYITC